MSSEVNSGNAKKNIADKIDGSIDRVDNSIKGKFNALSYKLAVYLAKQAKAYGIPPVGLHVGLGAAALAGGWLFYSTYVHMRTGYYESEMVSMFVQLAIGVVLIGIAQACHQAAKLLKDPKSLDVHKNTTTKSTPRRTDTQAETTQDSKEVKRPAARIFITYAVSAALGLAILMTAPRNILVYNLQQDGALFVWGWIALNAAYAYYLFKGGHWRFTINNVPMSWLSVTANVALFYIIFIFRG